MAPPVEEEKSIHVDAVSVKVPQFNSNNIRGWFVGLECAFGISRVTSGATKTLHLLHALPASVIESVPEISLYKSTFEEKDYEKYKTALIKRYSQTTWQKLDILFDRTPDVGKKPSELYYQFQKLANEPDVELPEPVLQYVWFKKLSTYVQDHMLCEMETFSADTDLDTADRFYHQELQVGQVSATTEPQQVLAMTHRPTRNRTPSNSTRQPSRPTPTGFKEDGRWCYFHFHYGKRAEKCKEGCKYLLDHPGNGRQ